MRSRGAKMSKIIEVEQQWKPRRYRRNRKWREGQRKMQALSAKIVKLLEDDDLDDRNSPCSVVSLSLSLDNRIQDPHENSEWIRTAHIKNPAVNVQDRRSPLFTGRMLRRNNLLDDIHGSKHGFSYEYPFEVRRNINTSRSCIRERLEPPEVSIHHQLEPGFDIPHLESSEIDIHQRLESSNVSIQQRMEAPMPLRESIGLAVPPEQLSFRQNQQDNEAASNLHPRFIRDQYDVYDTNRFSMNRFSPPQRPRCFRRSLYYPPGYTSPSNQDMVRRQRPTTWPWLKTSVDFSESAPDYTDHCIRRDRIDYNIERFARDTLLPSDQRYYGQSDYNHPQYFERSGNNLRESRSEMSLSSQEVKNYSDYRPEDYEMNYNNQRDDGQFGWSLSQVESYCSSFSPRRFYNSRPSPYSSGSSHPAHNSVLDTPRYRNLMESPSNNWEVPPGRNYHSSYQDRISDEDFTDSDQLDSEVEESDDNPKKQVRQTWKNLVKERGILISRDGTSAAMTRKSADYVKKILLEKASDSTKFPENWKPRFLRTGLVHRSGLYQIICKDYQTVMWTLKQEIPPFEGNGFKILKRPYDWDCGPVRISMWLASEPTNPQEALQSLDVENPGIGATNWRLVSVSIEDGWRQFIVDVSRESALYLENNGWTILYWNNLLPVTRIRNASKQLFFNQLAGDNL